MTPPVPGPAAGAVPTPWPATARYDIDPAPDGLGVVQDLLNTVDAGVPRQPDLLDDLTSGTRWAQEVTARWSAVTGWRVPEIVPDPAGLRVLRTFRDQLWQEIDSRLRAGTDPGTAAGTHLAGTDPGTAARTHLSVPEVPAPEGGGQAGGGVADRDATGLRTAGAVLRLDGTGVVHLEPAGTGADLLVSIVLVALFEAQSADVRRRLKTCRNPRCRVAFYDRSRNNSGVWHSVRVCGHPTNLRAHRARRRQPD